MAMEKIIGKCDICLDEKFLQFKTKRISICKACLSVIRNQAVDFEEIKSKISDIAKEKNLLPIDVLSVLQKKRFPPLEKEKSHRFLIWLYRAMRFNLLSGSGEIQERLMEEEWTNIRNSIIKQDGFRCNRCKKNSIKSEYHVHHMIPLQEHGTNHKNNLVFLCRACHQRQHKEFTISKNTENFIKHKNTTSFNKKDDAIEGKKNDILDVNQSSFLWNTSKVWQDFEKNIEENLLQDETHLETSLPKYLRRKELSEKELLEWDDLHEKNKKYALMALETSIRGSFLRTNLESFGADYTYMLAEILEFKERFEFFFPANRRFLSCPRTFVLICPNCEKELRIKDVPEIIECILVKCPACEKSFYFTDRFKNHVSI